MITEEQKKLVQDSWAKIAPAYDKAVRLFYNRLFELDPSLRKLFAVDMERQERKLTATMSVIVKGLLHLEALIPAVRELGRRHSSYGVQFDHYGTVGEALIWALDKSLNQDFTSEVREAWTDTYAHLAEVMKNAAGQSPVTTMA